MECEKRHPNHLQQPKTAQECLNGFTTINYNRTHCPVEWDPAAELCWPPAPAGTKSSVPCPNKPGINTQHSACRLCLFNGSWEVNPEQDPNGPYTNFNDCFYWDEKEYRMRLERMIGKDTVLIHETLIAPENKQFWLHGISLLFIGLGLLIWSAVWLRERNNSKAAKCKFMVLSYTVLLSLQCLYVFYFSLDYHQTLITCYLFRVIHSFLETLLYSSVFFYCLYGAMYISDISFSNLIRILVISLAVIAIAIVTCLEGWIEVDLHPNDFCSFGVYLNPVHWLILWVKAAINGGSLTLIWVSLFGLCYLKIPPKAKSKLVLIMKQNISILMFWIIFCYILQFCPIFIYHMQNLGYSIDEIVIGTRVYSCLMASSGIVFAFVTCFLDIEILAYVVPFVRNYLDKDEDVPILRVKVIKVIQMPDDLKLSKVDDPRSGYLISNFG